MARVLRTNDRAILRGDERHAAAPYGAAAWETVVKRAKGCLVPGSVADTFFGFKLYLDVEGQKPVQACPAEWNPPPAALGSVCLRSPLVFDPENEAGLAPWGRRARGAIVVAIRGQTSIEQMALHAGAAGAVGLVVVDNEPEAEWTPSWTAVREGSEGEVPPETPTAVVSGALRRTLCGREGMAPLHATISCR